MNTSSEELQKQNILIKIARQTGNQSPDILPPGTPVSTAPDVDTTNTNLVDNWVDNGDFDFSKDGYLNTTPVGGTDVPNECYNFFRHRLVKVTDVVTTNASASITSASGPFKATSTYPMSFVIYGAGGALGETLSGTLTRVSDLAATLSTNALATLTNATLWIGDTLASTAAQAIKYTGHSLYAANEGTNLNIPRWARTDGWVEMGSLDSERWSLDAPFAINVIRPSVTLFAICIIKKRASTAAMPNGAALFFGVWDGTAAQNRWLEGSNFDLTATAIGTTGATAVSYKAIAELSDGSTIESDVAAVANSNAVLSASNYNRLTWTNAPGILDFKLYRLMGGVYNRIFTITNGASDYNDTGGNEEVVGSFPVTYNTKPIVYKESSVDIPVDTGWTAIGVSMIVPTTYNTQNTTGIQWFRCGVVGPTTDNRSVLIDRLGLSFLSGGWNRSSRDRALIANNNPDSLPTSSDQGDVGIGRCLEVSTLIRIGKKNGTHLAATQIGGVERGDYAWDGGRRMRRIKKVRKATVKGLWLFILENGGWFRATGSERFITSRADREGTILDDLMPGDVIVSPDDAGTVSTPKIINMQWLKGEFEVVTLEFFEGGRIFAVGNMTDKGIIWAKAHNLKAPPPEIV